jgi:hypothetical protein
MVPALDPGIEIYGRNKRPADLRSVRPRRTLLFVLGTTYPARTTFDLKPDGLSCNLGHQSGGCKTRPAGDPRAQQRFAGLCRYLLGRQSLLRFNKNHRGGAVDYGGMG